MLLCKLNFMKISICNIKSMNDDIIVELQPLYPSDFNRKLFNIIKYFLASWDFCSSTLLRPSKLFKDNFFVWSFLQKGIRRLVTIIRHYDLKILTLRTKTFFLGRVFLKSAYIFLNNSSCWYSFFFHRFYSRISLFSSSSSSLRCFM